MSKYPTFRRETIWKGEPSERTLCVVGDVTGSGSSEIIIAGRNPKKELYYLTRLESGEWVRRDIGTTSGQLEAGGYLADINGSGHLDFLCGDDSQGKKIFWWENPGDPGKLWVEHLIYEMPDRQSHDQFAADLDGDGRLEAYFWNQFSQTLFWVPVPDDPTVTPWPNVGEVVSGVREEGFAVADVDGDGKPELIAGQSWYKFVDGAWKRHIITDRFVTPRVAAADFTGDGKVEVIFAEGDASGLLERYYGHVARCSFKDDPTEPWDVEILHDHLADPHSLAIADFNGSGQPDLFVGELGDPNANDRHPPKQRIYFNDGGELTEYVIEEGLGTHESKVIQIDGKNAIVCKPYRNVRGEIPRTPDVDSIHLWIPEG